MKRTDLCTIAHTETRTPKFTGLHARIHILPLHTYAHLHHIHRLIIINYVKISIQQITHILEKTINILFLIYSIRMTVTFEN